MEYKEYFLGLDMGTNSVGWAVTDTKYNLIRKKGKDFWGIREFDEAQSAVDRRVKRTARRRLQRVQAKIGMLRLYFKDEIEKVDPNFYQRLDNSKYFEEDKDEQVRGINGVFADKGYTDKEYYKEYPTIFHLRKAFLDGSVRNDVRLLFLAVLNMFKHRGHFLNAGLSDDGEGINMKVAYAAFVATAADILGLNFPDNMTEVFEKLLSDRSMSRKRKSEELSVRLGLDKKDKKKLCIVKAISGLKVDLRDIFEDFQDEEKIEICFSEASYEEKRELALEKIGEDNFALIEDMKQVYDAGSLANILKGQTYLSFSRVEEYEKHKADLKTLKQIYQEYKTIEDYNHMFRGESAGTYSAYVNSFNTGDKKRRSFGTRTRDELYKNIKNDLKGIDDARIQKVFEEIENETFLPKQLTAGNGVIPNQVHKRELSKILSNAEEIFPFLKEKDESGLSVRERILKLFSFQIPYYIGPVSEKSLKDGGNGWVIRKEAGQVLPWNIDKKIDVEKTSEKFIEKLINSCTYISDEKVLPKGSLLYEKYCVLNEINNLKIDGEKISVELKQAIYRELFCKGKKVTRGQIENYLVRNGYINDKTQISGIDINVNNALTSYGRMYSVFGEDLNNDDVWNLAEEIIKLCTIYGDSKKMLKSVLEKRFGDKLDEGQIKRVLGYKFKDWGRLSKQFFELNRVNTETGEIMSLIRAMWETNNNLNELLFNPPFEFKKALEEKQSSLIRSLSEFRVEDLEGYYFSAPVRRMIWQTLQIIKEVEEVMGSAPKRIFIEMTRTDEEKGDKRRKDSRAKQLLELYKNIKEAKDLKDGIEIADKNGLLRSKKLYLYYLQMGRCMYTGEHIDLGDLFNDNLYDIDHIYPRHYVKDDNILNNLVLVKKSCNAYKSDNYPLPPMSAEVYDLWKMLLEKKLITEEKYHRLTGKKPFTDEEKAGFIARQLVETGQGTKGVADLLKELNHDSEIVYSKGRNVSDFRKDYKFYKSRSINDFHHAKDAYLNIVVGNAYFVKFTQNPLKRIKELQKQNSELKYHLGRMFERDILWKDEVAWVASKKDGETGTIEIVKKVMKRNTPMITRMSFEGHGEIANATLYSLKGNEDKAENYISLKGSDEKMHDVKKYGGYKKVSTAYFFLVEHDEKQGKRIRTIETVPIYLKDKIQNKEDLTKYCIENLGLKNPSVRVEKIKIQSMLKINGFYYHLSCKTLNQIELRNAVSLCLDLKYNDIIHYLDKYDKEKIVPKEVTAENNISLFKELIEKHRDGIFSKRINPVGDKLGNGVEVFKNLSIEEQCKVLLEVLKLSVQGCTSADFSLLKGKKTVGTIKQNKVISKEKDFCLINKSVTGLFENRIDLLTV